MDVLLSWSKKQSREAARAFHQWLPKVLPEVTPWHSKFDIEKGTRWFDELQAYLRQAKACIVFVTPENVDSPWIYWETGAIASVKGDEGADRQKGARIMPLLLNVPMSVIDATPLAQYQASPASKEEILLMVETLNDLLERPFSQDALRGRFEHNWDELGRHLVKLEEMAMPYNVLALVKTLQQQKGRFLKEWPAAAKADTDEPAKLLLMELRAALQKAYRTEEIGAREQKFCGELDKIFYDSLSTGYRQTRIERAQKIPDAFDKQIDAIKSGY